MSFQPLRRPARPLSLLPETSGIKVPEIATYIAQTQARKISLTALSEAILSLQSLQSLHETEWSEAIADEMTIARLIKTASAHVPPSEITWQDALHLRLLGLNPLPDIIAPINFDPNSVHEIARYPSASVFRLFDDQQRSWVCKLRCPYECGILADVLEEIEARGGKIYEEARHASESLHDRVVIDIRIEARNIAARRVDQVLGLNFVPDCFVAKVPVPAPPLVCRYDTITPFGLIMVEVAGQTFGDIGQMKNFSEIVLDPALKRDLVNLATFDAIIGSLDRNEGNILIEVSEGRYERLHAIDNDFCLTSAHFDLDWMEAVPGFDQAVLQEGTRPPDREGAEAHNSRHASLLSYYQSRNMRLVEGQALVNTVGLPPVMDVSLAQKLCSPHTEAMLVDAVSPFLRSEEITEMAGRLFRLRAHVGELKSRDRIISDWTSHHDNSGLSLDYLLSDRRHCHWIRMIERSPSRIEICDTLRLPQ